MPLYPITVVVADEPFPRHGHRHATAGEPTKIDVAEDGVHSLAFDPELRVVFVARADGNTLVIPLERVWYMLGGQGLVAAHL